MLFILIDTIPKSPGIGHVVDVGFAKENQM